MGGGGGRGLGEDGERGIGLKYIENINGKLLEDKVNCLIIYRHTHVHMYRQT